MTVIKKFEFSPFAENTYVIWDEETNDCMIVDPGCLERHEEEKLSDFIQQRFLNVKYLINTHCHIDHIFGNKFVKERYNPTFYAPEQDLPLLNNADKQAAAFGVHVEESPQPDFFITEKVVLKIGNAKCSFLFTPGHTPGEYCIYFEEDKICITGDVLFKGSVGRTDLWGGDYATLIRSIKEKLMTLPDDVIIYPGHGEKSSIGKERDNNPFLA